MWSQPTPAMGIGPRHPGRRTEATLARAKTPPAIFSGKAFSAAGRWDSRCLAWVPESSRGLAALAQFFKILGYCVAILLRRRFRSATSGSSRALLTQPPAQLYFESFELCYGVLADSRI